VDLGSEVQLQALLRIAKISSALFRSFS